MTESEPACSRDGVCSTQIPTPMVCRGEVVFINGWFLMSLVTAMHRTLARIPKHWGKTEKPVGYSLGRWLQPAICQPRACLDATLRATVHKKPSPMHAER